MIETKISKNLKITREITDIRELIQLAKEHKSIAYKAGLCQTWFVRPAAVVVNWSLSMLSRRTFYKTEKISTLK